MRLRNTLLLTVILILLGAYIYFFELKKGGQERGERLLSFKEEEVQSIVLTYPRQEIRLEKRSSGQWKLTQPLQAAADESTISSILSTLNTSEVNRIVEKKPTPEDLKGFGLDQPSAELSITLKNGITLPSILVGSKTPFGNSAYVQRGREPGVLLTSSSLRSSLEKKLYDFRDKEVFPFPRDKVAKLHIQTPKESWLLVKGGKEEWKLEAPKKGKAREGVVNDYLTVLGNLRAKGFAEDTPKDIKKYGLDPSSFKISLDGRDGKNLGTLMLGSKIGGDYYVKREGNPAVYMIEESSYNQINKQLTGFLEEEKKETLPLGGTKK